MMNPWGKQLQLFTSIFFLLMIIIQNTISSPTATRPEVVISLSHDHDKEAGLKVNQAIPISYNYKNNDEKEMESDPVGTLGAESQLPDDLTSLLDSNSISPQVQRHLLSKRQVRNNDYERFYLCLFTLFTNPDCRQRAELNNNNGNANRDLINNDNQMQFLPLLPTTNQNQYQQRPLNFLGLGLNGLGQLGQGFGLNRFQNNFQQPQQQQQPIFESNFFTVTQSPYPEPQVHRRPGPESLERQHEFYPFKTTATTTTTTLKPTTTTNLPELFGTPLTTTKAQPIFEEFTSVTFSPQDLIEVTASSSEVVDSSTISTTTKPTLNCNTTKTSQTESESDKLIENSSIEKASALLFEKRFQQFAKLEEENGLLKSQAFESTEQLKSYQTQTKYLQEALSSVQEDSSRFKKRVALLERTNNDLQQQNGQLQHATGDQRTLMNELKNKVKYLEDKLLRLSRQNLPLTKEIQRHQQEVRELDDKLRKLQEDNRECRNQVYHLQLRQTEKFRQESAEVIGHRVGLPKEESMEGVNSTEVSSSEIFTTQDTSSSSAEVTTELSILDLDFDSVEPELSILTPNLTQIIVPSESSVEPEPTILTPNLTQPSESPVAPNLTQVTLPSESPPVVVVDPIIPDLTPEVTGSSRDALNSEEELAQYNPYLLRLPLFPRIFDQSHNLGYGQSQAYYRNL